MRIAVVLPSRGHSHRLVAILTALDHLAGGQQEVRYHLFVDDDDTETIQAVRDIPMLKESIQLEIGSSSISHFSRINEAVSGLDADVATWFADDVFPMTLHWDQKIAQATAGGVPAFAWTEVTDPHNVTYPILSRRWLEVLGYLFPEYFPYWFVDTWIMEVSELAFCRPYPIMQDLPVGGRRGTTGNMHELQFWFDFFEATHCERVRDAERVAQGFKTDVTPERVAAVKAEHHQRYLRQCAKVPDYEKAFGADTTPQSDRYRRLKSEAEQWLRDHGNS